MPKHLSRSSRPLYRSVAQISIFVAYRERAGLLIDAYKPLMKSGPAKKMLIIKVAKSLGKLLEPEKLVTRI